jgi:hypothetical protein
MVVREYKFRAPRKFSSTASGPKKPKLWNPAIKRSNGEIIIA